MRGRRLLVALGLLLLAACAGRNPEAWLLLDDVIAGAGQTALKAETPSPQRTAMSWSSGGAAATGDLYLPRQQPALARLVLVPGLSPHGKDDPRLVNLARTLARLRFAVLVPELAGLRELRASSANTGEIAEAARFLAAHPLPSLPPGPVGVAAISYAAGPAVLAALRPETRDAIAFVLTVGGYYDIEGAITYVTTGYSREEPSEPWRRGSPSPVAKWWFVRANAARLDSAGDAAILAELADRRSREAGAPVDDLVARLGPEGRAVLALVENTDPDGVSRLIAALPETLQAEFRALSPAAHDLAAIEARLILVHGRNDPVIPVSESRRLLAAVPAGRAELHEVASLDHADFDVLAGLADQRVLLRVADVLLGLRDELAARASPPLRQGAGAAISAQPSPSSAGRR